ncbi:MAG: hypothetical protein ACT4NU_13700 [Chromatiales bacterium]
MQSDAQLAAPAQDGIANPASSPPANTPPGADAKLSGAPLNIAPDAARASQHPLYTLVALAGADDMLRGVTGAAVSRVQSWLTKVATGVVIARPVAKQP